MSELTQANSDVSAVVNDARGRKLTVRQPDFLQESRITKLCGEASTNVGYMYAYVFPAIAVIAVDGDAVPFPTTYLQIEGLIARVGREGCSAVLNHMSSAHNAEAHREDVKN